MSNAPSSVQLPNPGLVMHPDHTTDEGYTRLQVLSQAIIALTTHAMIILSSQAIVIIFLSSKAIIFFFTD